MDLENKIKKEKTPEDFQNNSQYSLMCKIKENIIYKVISGAIATLGLMYAVNIADFNNTKYLNTTSASSTTESCSLDYKEIHLYNEEQLKEKIEDCEVCWVMYTFEGVSPLYEDRAQHFWQRLKAEI